MTIEFTIPGVPQGKERPRFTQNSATYTPKKTKDYEKLVAWAYQDDAAITDATVCKRYGTRPCVVVRLTGEEAPRDTV